MYLKDCTFLNGVSQLYMCSLLICDFKYYCLIIPYHQFKFSFSNNDFVKPHVEQELSASLSIALKRFGDWGKIACIQNTLIKQLNIFKIFIMLLTKTLLVRET